MFRRLVWRHLSWFLERRRLRREDKRLSRSIAEMGFLESLGHLPQSEVDARQAMEVRRAQITEELG